MSKLCDDCIYSTEQNNCKLGHIIKKNFCENYQQNNFSLCFKCVNARPENLWEPHCFCTVQRQVREKVKECKDYKANE